MTISEKQKKADLIQWAKAQALAHLGKLERTGKAETLSLQWPYVKQGFISGAIFGVMAGFSIGFETARKMREKEENAQAELPLEDTKPETPEGQGELFDASKNRI